MRAPFGIALQGIRDNPRRMNSLGFNVIAHRVAAYAVAGVLAAIGGVLIVWYNGLITPGSIGTSWLINILIIAVLGGMRHPIGPFLGAIVFVLLQTFAIDLFDRERFNLVIGGVFLAIVLFSPDGLLGLWSRCARSSRGSARGRACRRGDERGKGIHSRLTTAAGKPHFHQGGNHETRRRQFTRTLVGGGGGRRVGVCRQPHRRSRS